LERLLNTSAGLSVSFLQFGGSHETHSNKEQNYRHY
jgi:hypothetical protein